MSKGSPVVVPSSSPARCGTSMTIVEAIRAIQKDPTKWARPLEWAGWRTALYCTGDALHRFNPPLQETPYRDTCVIGAARFITQEWEVVDPVVVKEGG